jgi:hypothetical protein
MRFDGSTLRERDAPVRSLPGQIMTLTDTVRTPAAPPSRALQDMPASEIVRRIAARELCAAEAVEHFIARLEIVNPKLNAVTVKLFESARKKAAEVDQALSRGEKLGPLAGLPVTIKECFDLAGTASTYGLSSRRNQIETTNDPHVAALLAAGAIPIAKTNLPQLMIFTESDNPLYGRTNNPWDLERSCGGSRAAGKALSSPPAPRRLASAMTSAAPCGFPPLSAGSLRSSRPPGASPIIATTAYRSDSRGSQPKPGLWRDTLPTLQWDCACWIAPAIRSFIRDQNWAIRLPSTLAVCVLRHSPTMASFRSRRQCAALSPKLPRR